MAIKQSIIFVAENKYLHLFLGSMTILAGFTEIWGTISEDFISGTIRGAHGVIIIGVLHFFRALAEFVEAADYLKESIE
jgi:hypothetical protein